MADAGAAREISIRFTLNGRVVDARIPTDALLLDVVRDRFGLTGTKESCGVGVCGACTVLLDGRPVSSCLLLSALADGGEVWTIEGLAGRLDRLDESDAVRRFLDVRQAMLEQEGLQCGICTPGVVVSACALLEKTPRPTDDEIVEWMAGNLCRCTGYRSILRSIRVAAGLPPGDEEPAEVTSDPAAPHPRAGPSGA